MRRLLVIISVASVFAGVAAASAAAFSINLIRPWGSSVLTAPNTDSISLTYSVSAGKRVSSNAVDAAGAAAAAWASWVSGQEGSGTFTITQAVGGKPNVPITIKNGGGVVAGQTKLSFDRQGFVKGATVQISGSSFGLANDYDTVYEITLHELGHAFVGLGHSDDPADLMYPTLNGTTSIGACEVSGFGALYGWLTDGNASTGPTLPGVNSVGC